MLAIVLNYYITVCSLMYCKQRIGVIWLHWWQNDTMMKRAGILQELRIGLNALACGRVYPNARYYRSNEQYELV